MGKTLHETEEAPRPLKELARMMTPRAIASDILFDKSIDMIDPHVQEALCQVVSRFT